MASQTTTISPAGDVPSARGMRIASVETVLLSHPTPEAEPIVWSGGKLTGFTAGLVRITTDDGMVGIGESYAGFFAPEVMSVVVDFYRPLLLGRDPSRITEIWNLCYSRSLYWGRYGINVSVLSAIEGALWDLCGQALNEPVHALLGGAKHESLPIYASAGMDKSDIAFADEQRGFKADGYTASKIRIGHGLDEDSRKVALARDVLGPDVGLAVDAVQGSNPSPWGSQQAIEVGRAIEQFDLLWIEEPCAAFDVEGNRRCREALAAPIAGGETATSADQLIALIEDECFDIAQPDAAHMGGLMQVMMVAEVAGERGVDLAMHAWGCGGTVMANYHVGFAVKACVWLEHPAVGNPMRDALLVEPLDIRNGRVYPPSAPGLGLRLTPDLEERFAYSTNARYAFGER